MTKLALTLILALSYLALIDASGLFVRASQIHAMMGSR